MRALRRLHGSTASRRSCAASARLLRPPDPQPARERARGTARRRCGSRFGASATIAVLEVMDAGAGHSRGRARAGVLAVPPAERRRRTAPASASRWCARSRGCTAATRWWRRGRPAELLPGDAAAAEGVIAATTAVRPSRRRAAWQPAVACGSTSTDCPGLVERRDRRSSRPARRSCPASASMRVEHRAAARRAEVRFVEAPGFRDAPMALERAGHRRVGLSA